MRVLIFKTDVRTPSKLQIIKNVFNKHLGVLRWNIDMEDIDNVLRIEANVGLQETEVISIIKKQGLYCEELLD